MTTSNVKSVKQTTDELVKTAEETRARRKLLATSKKSNETKRAAIDETEQLVKEGTHVVLMSLNDKRDSLDAADEKVEEELSQLDPNYFAKEQATTPVAPVPEPVPTPEPAPPAQPTEPVQATPTVVLEPQQEIGVPATQVVTTERHYHYLNPRGWGWLRWLLAIILGLLGLFIGLKTVNWVVSDWNNDWWTWFVVMLQVIFGFIWIVAWTGVGFFGGSLLGDFVGRRVTTIREERRTRVAQPVPPAVPTPPAA
ncbi:MAG: hypothetical protein JWN12_231 [Candidatus Saccharibacteria bacterium]|nr:hypothetical protein [Candidatus Saccharibacteria bacterium]